MYKRTPVETQASFTAGDGLVRPCGRTAGETVQVSAFILSVIVCVLFSFTQVILHLPGTGDGAGIEWQEKINPNTAPVASLMRLPGIGYSRATAIMQYRENGLGGDIASLVFKKSKDLENVRGLGPKTVETISGWLEFGE